MRRDLTERKCDQCGAMRRGLRDAICWEASELGWFSLYGTGEPWRDFCSLRCLAEWAEAHKAQIAPCANGNGAPRPPGDTDGPEYPRAARTRQRAVSGRVAGPSGGDAPHEAESTKFLTPH